MDIRMKFSIYSNTEFLVKVPNHQFVTYMLLSHCDEIACSNRFITIFYFSQTFHEVISFLYSFVTKMQEGDYDAEPKEESKV